MAKHFIGLMSGTSADGIDAVAVTLGGDRRFAIAAHIYEPYPPALRDRILALMTPGENEIDRMGALEVDLAEKMALAATRVRKAAGLAAADIHAIGSHGQTIRHRPRGSAAFTLQIGDPARIAERTGITVIGDFRRRDVAAGGQGAPLVPAFHRWLFAHPQKLRAIVNIGGIANVTIVPPRPTDEVKGFDTGPGNALLDAWIGRAKGLPYDADGAFAAAGHPNEALLSDLLDEPYFSAPPPKSTGREQFTQKWLDERLRRHPGLDAADIQATLAKLTAITIVDAMGDAHPDELFLCGGGSQNATLVRELAAAFGGPVATTEALGLAPHLVEPSAFAWLAAETLAGRPGNLPAVTGASHAVVLGGIYPG